MNLTIGIDEAGRGPVIGPLVVAGVSLEKEAGERLRSAGVKDSKMLSIKKIYALEEAVKREATDFVTMYLDPCIIDSRYSNGTNLNYLELDVMARIANALSGREVIVDCLTRNTKKIEAYLRRTVSGKGITARNCADRDFIEVSAASILAKAARERAIIGIKAELGQDFGSGYPSDPRTRAFIKALESAGKLETEPYARHIRRSWMTVQNLRN